MTRRFQPRDLTAAYKAQFRTRKRQKVEAIPTYVDVLQKLAEMAWALLAAIARDEMVADHFLNGLDSHELRVQVAATGIRRIKDLMQGCWRPSRIKKLDMDGSAGGQLRPDSRKKRAPKTEATRIAEQILAKLEPELTQSRDPKRRPPTPGPQRVRSVERETSQAPSKDSSKSKGAEKAVERNRRRLSSTDRS